MTKDCRVLRHFPWPSRRSCAKGPAASWGSLSGNPRRKQALRKLLWPQVPVFSLVPLCSLVVVHLVISGQPCVYPWVDSVQTDRRLFQSRRALPRSVRRRRPRSGAGRSCLTAARQHLAEWLWLWLWSCSLPRSRAASSHTPRNEPEINWVKLRFS